MTQRHSLARAVCSGIGRSATVVAAWTNRRDAEDLAQMSPALGTALGAEVRADLIGDIGLDAARSRVAGPVIYALRSTEHKGAAADPAQTRSLRLRSAAASGFDLVDLEFDRDLVPDVLAAIPAPRRLVSWHGPVGELRTRIAEVTGVPAAMYRLTVTADSFEDALQPLRLLAMLRRDDVTAFGTGPAAAFGRVLAPWFGAPIVFGGPDGPTTRELLTDYPFPRLPSLDGVYGIVNRALGTSKFLSRVNAAFAILGLPHLYLPFVVADTRELRDQFWPTVTSDGLGVPLRGFTVAAPYKPTALAVSDAADQSARAAQAANLVLRNGRRWLAATTDGAAMLSALLALRAVAGSRAAVVGCGAAGRSAAYALAHAGAHVTLVNRDPHRGRFAADLLGLPLVELGRFSPDQYDVIVHATPAAQAPFDVDLVTADSIIADFACAAEPTALITAARQRGLAVVDGQEVLAREVVHQFQLMTGRPMPDLNGDTPSQR